MWYGENKRLVYKCRMNSLLKVMKWRIQQCKPLRAAWIQSPGCKTHNEDCHPSPESTKPGTNNTHSGRDLWNPEHGVMGILQEVLSRQWVGLCRENMSKEYGTDNVLLEGNGCSKHTMILNPLWVGSQKEMKEDRQEALLMAQHSPGEGRRPP